MDAAVDIQETVTSRPLRPHLLVGVDERHVNEGAVRWAAAEAADRHVALRLTTICRIYPEAEVYAGSEVEDAVRADLQELADRLAVHVDVLPVSVSSGGPVTGLLSQTADARLLVVGHRDLGTLHRSTLGSTSIAVAGRSPVTVVVVPDRWASEDGARPPLVLGVRLPESDDETHHPASLDYAFDRAHLLQVPLVVVHAWEVPAVLTWSPLDLAAERHRVTGRVEQLLAPWRRRHPDVAVDVRVMADRPADALREAAATSQLVILGRRTAPDRHGGFRLGSTARAFLHHAETPVAVVPAEPAVPS